VGAVRQPQTSSITTRKKVRATERKSESGKGKEKEKEEEKRRERKCGRGERRRERKCGRGGEKERKKVWKRGREGEKESVEEEERDREDHTTNGVVGGSTKTGSEMLEMKSVKIELGTSSKFITCRR
jgi:hypothetical protein